MKSVVVTVQPMFLGREDAAKHLALSVSTFEKLVREESIPMPYQLSDRRVGWRRTELDEWGGTLVRSKLLPPENTGAPKPRRAKAAANDATMRSIAQTGQ